MKEQMKLLIGYDGSQSANAALDDLRRAGLPREAQAVILTVSERWLPHLSANGVAVANQATVPAVSQNHAAIKAQPATEARALAREAKAVLQSHFPDWAIEVDEASGSPAREILKKAKALKPHLIALGSQGRSGLGSFLLGTVSQKVANEARCSVRIARGTAWKDGAPLRILLALDGSPCSKAAVKAISHRMWPPASEVRLISVIDPSNGATPPTNGGSGREWVQRFMNTAARELRSVDLVVSSKIEQGDPKKLIMTGAEEWGAECIFLGASSDRNSSEQCLLGSVATAVVCRAHCSVEVIRPPETS